MASEVSSETTTNQGREEETRLKLPLGFHFHPYDEELIVHYLIDEPPKFIFPGYSALVGMKKKTLVSSTGRAPIEHQTGVDVSTESMRLDDLDGRLGQGGQDEQYQFRFPRTRNYILQEFDRVLPGEEDQDERHRLQLELWKNPWDSAHDKHGLNMTTPREEDSVHCSVPAPKGALVRYSTSDVPRNKIFPLKIIPAIDLVLVHIVSSCGRYSSHHGDLKPDNVLLDEKTENQLSDTAMSGLLHANDYIHLHIPMDRAVPSHDGPLDAKFSGKPSVKRCNEIKICSHKTKLLKYLSVHHHPLIKMWPSASKWSSDILTSCARLITPKRACGGIFTAKPKYETPNAGAGPVSEYIIRKLFERRNRLTVNESEQHSDPDSRRAKNTKMAATSASWIIATAAPHHATGDRNLLSGFTMEHDDLFVHAVNRVPMKVIARGAVVTDALILPDVWFVPGLKENLVSVSQLAELDHSIGFGRGECCIRSASDAKIIGKGRLQKDGQYVLDYLKVPLAI